MGNKPQIIISTTSTAIELEVKENKFWVKDVMMKEKEEENLEMIVIPPRGVGVKLESQLEEERSAILSVRSNYSYPYFKFSTYK